jgi:type II secretory pathway pseudopilin PulG
LNRYRTRGASILEVLVVLAIVVIIVALVSAALANARESARRMSCQSRLRQLGIAQSNYESVHGCVPPLGIYGSHSNRLSCFVMLLPHLDHPNIWNAVNCAHTPGSRANRTIARTAIDSFLCPSGVGDVRYLSENAAGDFAISIGSGSWITPGNGAGVLDRFRRYRDVTDGLSRTAFATELRRAKDVNLRSVIDDGGRGMWLPLAPAPNDRHEFGNACSQAPIDRRHFGVHLGSSWMTGMPGLVGYNHQLTPNSRSCIILGTDHPGSGMGRGSLSAGSHHSAGVNLVMLDGSVTFQSETVDLAVWRAARSIDGTD